MTTPPQAADDATANSPEAFGPIGLVTRILVVFLLIAPLSAIYVTVCLLLLPSRVLRIRAGNLYGKIVGRWVQRVTGILPRIHDQERVGGSAPAIYVCNHASSMDMWVGMWLCPYNGCGVAKKEIVLVPFFGQAYFLSGHLLLDRGNRERAIASMERVRQVVERYKLSLWMWPEGTRSRDGRLQPMKKGFVHLAIATGLPVVPLVFHDADLRWPGRSFQISPGPLDIEVLPPVDTSNWKAETASDHAKTIWSLFQEKLGPRQQGLGEASAPETTD